jgi:FkbM family methyltransferase
MNSIAINLKPAMTRHLVGRTDLLRENPVVIVDVGARSGFKEEWKEFGDCLRVFCFEPDREECETLNASAAANVTYLPFALGARSSAATLYHTRFSDSTGLYKTNWDYFSRLLNRDNAIVMKEEAIQVTTLDEALKAAGVQAIDFIKLDVEGAELDVLLGAAQHLTSPCLLGVLSEFRFHEEINGSPVFSQLDAYLHRFGFRLFDMHFSHQTRRALPYEGLADYWLPSGERFYAYTVHGQIMDGDALYFRDLLIPANEAIRAGITPAQLLKAASLFEIYALNDCAAELIIEHRDRLAGKVDCDELLDLLTPRLRGRRLKYGEYMSAYFADRWRASRVLSLAKRLAKGLLRRLGINHRPLVDAVRRMLK